MQLVNFLSDEPKTEFAPSWNYFIGETNLTDINFQEIADLILKMEPKIIQSTLPVDKQSVDGYTGLGENSLTSRYESFNVFSWDNSEVQKVKKQVVEHYKNFLKLLNKPRRKVYIQCWANVLRDGQEIKPHIHSVTPYCYLGGHVTVQCSNTSTCYINPVNQIVDPMVYDSKNLVGKLTLFPQNIPHYTTKHSSNQERITIAFDIIVEEFYDMMENKEHLILFDEGK